MATRPKPLVAKHRQLIGIARRELGVPEEAHRALVRRITDGRTDTTTRCTLAELREVLREYKASGFQVRPARAAGRRTPPADALDLQPMLAKVEALLADQGLPWGYAEAILRRQRGHAAHVAAPIHLATPEELRGVIAALWRHRVRQAQQPTTAGREDHVDA